MVCTKCLTDKNISDFSLRHYDKNIRHKMCKSCHSLYRQQHYLKNKEKYLIKARKWNKKQGEALSKYLFNKLSHSICIDCGEKDIIVLDFDHIENKKLGISEMYKNRYSLEAVEQEIKKCVVRCANCHRRKTAVTSKFWKYKMLEK